MSKQAHPIDMQREFEGLVMRVAMTPVCMLDAKNNPIHADKQQTIRDLFPEFSNQLLQALKPLKDNPDYQKTNGAARKDFLDAMYHLTTNLVNDVLQEVSVHTDAPEPTLSHLAHQAAPSLSVSFSHHFAFQKGLESPYFQEHILPRIHFYTALHNTDIQHPAHRALEALQDVCERAPDVVTQKLKEANDADAKAKAGCMKCLCEAILKPSLGRQSAFAALSPREKGELILTMQTAITPEQSLAETEDQTHPSGPRISEYAKGIHGLLSSESLVYPIEIFPSAQHAEQPVNRVEARTASRALIPSSPGRHHQARLDAATGGDPRVVSIVAARERAQASSGQGKGS